MSHNGSSKYNKVYTLKPMDELSAQTPINQDISHLQDSNDSRSIKRPGGLGSIASFKNSDSMGSGSMKSSVDDKGDGAEEIKQAHSMDDDSDK